jgi:fructokinase
MVDDLLVGAIEAGGTKFVCAVGTGPGEGLRARVEIPTTENPRQVLADVVAWFVEQQKSLGKIGALGVASFGPVDLDRTSSTYGFITSTPKPGWRNTDLLGFLQHVFPGIPIGFDTDVNGAALGEYTWGSTRGVEDFVYITIGTGIGAGGMVGGKLVHGLVHPEIGHMRLARKAGDDFAGVCRYHGACWEGLCSGPAIEARTGMAAHRLPANHSGWQLEMNYVAQAIGNLVCVLSPRRIIVGGSVRKGGHLGEAAFFAGVRRDVRASLNGYIESPWLEEKIEAYIVPPELGDDAGVCGAIALGLQASSYG